jgi:hypothetical protein
MPGGIMLQQFRPVPAGLAGLAMTETEICNYHERVAARLQAVAATLTTPAL